MSGAHQMCATESQEASIGRERRQYFSSPAFAELVSPIGTVMTATTHSYAIADFALLPLAGAMMTRRARRHLVHLLHVAYPSQRR